MLTRLDAATRLFGRTRSRGLYPVVAAVVLLAPAPALAQCSGSTCALSATGNAAADTANLQAALNHDPGGSRIVELSGTFQLTRNVYVNYDNTTIRGQGKITGPPFVFWPHTWQPHVGIRIWGGEQVAWTSGLGVSASGGTLTKTTPDAWTGGAISTRALQPGSRATPLISGDGYVEFTPGNTNTYRLIGLGNGSSNAQQPGLIDFALYMDAATNLYVIEGGRPVGWLGHYASNDRLRVSVEDGRVLYGRNGTQLYESRRLPLYPLIVAASLYSQGATLQDVVMGGSLAPFAATPEYGRRIMPGESRFSVMNALTPADMVMVWNYPADSTKRRKELSIVAADSTSTRLSLEDAALFEYLEGVSFTKIAPRRNVTIEGITLDSVAVNVNLARDFTLKDLTARRVGFRAFSCYSCNVLNLDFDARGDDPNPGTSSAIDFAEASRRVTIAGGSYRHYRGFEEPGILKLNQVANATIRDLTAEDVRAVSRDFTWTPDGRPIFRADTRAKMSAIMIDTNYGPNPTGYTDVPSVDITISNVTANDSDYGIFATTFAHTPIQGLKVLRYNRTHSDGAPIYIRGCEDVLFQDLHLPELNDHLRIESSKRVRVVNTEAGRFINRVLLQDLGRIFPAWGTRRNSDVTFQGVTFWYRNFVAYQNTLLPIFYDVDDIRFSDVRFVLPGSNSPVGAAWFERARNVTLRNVSISPFAAPLWAWTPVEGFLAGNSGIAAEGAPWPPMEFLATVGAGIFNVAGEPGWSYSSDGTNYCRSYPATAGPLVAARPYDMGYSYECNSSSGPFRVADFTYYSTGQLFCMFPPGATLPANVPTYSKYPAIPYNGYCQ